jgi:excisionase family DNA binding protein
MPKLERLLSVEEAAQLTSTSPAYWRKLISRRRIPIHKVGRLTRIAERDLDAVLRAGFRPARQAEGPRADRLADRRERGGATQG